MKPSYTLHLATLFSVLAIVLGVCNISPQMRSGRYFEYYSQPRSSVSRWYISYDTTTIESGLYASDVATDPVITTGYTCLSQHFVDNTFYFHERIDSSQTYFCTKVTISGNALLVQRHQPVSSTIPASMCPSLITGDAYWQVKESNPVVTIPWPFTQGTYRATYEVLNADFPFCTGSVTSTAIVSGSSVTIDSCYRDIVRIDTPFRGTFTALASLPGDALDHNIHGDLLLVSAQLHQVNTPRYYCARYSEGEANGVREFYFILYISDERYITCKVNNLIDVPFVKFTFKQMPITTPNPNGTPAPTDPPTAPPVYTPPPGTCGSEYDEVQWWNGAGANGVTFTQEFRGDELIRKANDLEIEKISCYDQYTDQHSADDHMYILRHHSSDFNERQCVIYYPTDQPSVVLERELDAGLSIYTANQCVAPLLRQGYRITALINSATLDISAGRLPADIPRRSFNANFVESLEGGNRCLNDLESTIVTTDNTITFNLCTTDNTYERPHNTELRVVATWEEDLVDDQQGVADGRGNFILLAYDDNGTNKYICARYTVESTIEEVSFYMSLMRSQPNGAICNTEASSKTFGIFGGNQYTTYLFYYYTGEFAATQPPVYITTPSAPCGPTAGGSQCLNGGNCQHAINQYVCVCGPGFTGAQCETALPEGDCRECASGQTERCVPDRGYYYCHCADGFYGQQCQVDYDECASDPCQNGGECVDQVNKFICECTGDFDGTHCHLELSNKDSDQTLIIIIVVVVAIVVALVVITAVAICQIRRRRRMMKNGDDTEMMEKAPSDKGDGTGDNYATANAWFADYKQDGSAPTANSKMEMD